MTMKCGYDNNQQTVHIDKGIHTKLNNFRPSKHTYQTPTTTKLKKHTSTTEQKVFHLFLRSRERREETKSQHNNVDHFLLLNSTLFHFLLPFPSVHPPSVSASLLSGALQIPFNLSAPPAEALLPDPSKATAVAVTEMTTMTTIMRLY